MSAAWSLFDEPAQIAPPLVAHALALPNASAIPPREWLFGTGLVRRFVTVLVAPGGVGKSAYALAQCVSLATGRNLLGQPVHRPVAAWMLNLEDPMDELHRRLAALCLRHGIDPAELAGRLFLNSGRTRRLCIARRDHGDSIVFPDQAAVIEAARAHRIGVIMVDPFVKSHGLQENNNAEMDAAATAWAEIAEATGAGVQLVHHVRKPAPGTSPAADVDAARGAKALTDAARIAVPLSAMTPAEADQLGVKPADRWRHIRLDDGKANMAPRAGRARWFKLESVPLGNGTEDYPAGDTVAVVVPWSGDSVWRRLDANAANRALDVIAAGPAPGVLYAAQRKGNGTQRWAGHILVEQFGLTESQASEALAAWLKSGTLRTATYRDPEQRKSRQGVAVVDALRPTPTREPNGLPAFPQTQDTEMPDA